MATSLGQQLQYSCLKNPLSDREAWQACLQGRKESDTTEATWVHKCKRFFFACDSSAPVRVEHEGGAVAWFAGTLEAPSCRDTDCLCRRSYGPMRVFFRTSCSWQSEGLFGQSFSVALPIQALRGFPCLRSFSVVQYVRHIELPPHPPPPTGVLLCSSVCQAFDGPISLLFSCRCWQCGER